MASKALESGLKTWGSGSGFRRGKRTSGSEQAVGVRRPLIAVSGVGPCGKVNNRDNYTLEMLLGYLRYLMIDTQSPTADGRAYSYRCKVGERPRPNNEFRDQLL